MLKWKRNKAGYYTAHNEEFSYRIVRHVYEWVPEAYAISATGGYEPITHALIRTLREAKEYAEVHNEMCQTDNNYEFDETIGNPWYISIYTSKDILLRRFRITLLHRFIEDTYLPKALRELLSIARDEAIDLGYLKEE